MTSNKAQSTRRSLGEQSTADIQPIVARLKSGVRPLCKYDLVAGIYEANKLTIKKGVLYAPIS